MEYVKTSIVVSEERSLAKSQTVQWYASQATVTFALVYMIFGYMQPELNVLWMTPEYVGGLGLLMGLVSAVVAGFGAAMVASRPGANWTHTKKKAARAYTGASLVSLLACLAQVALTAYIVRTTQSETMLIINLDLNSSRGFPAQAVQGILGLTAQYLMLASGFCNFFGDVFSAYYALKVSRA